MGGDSTAECPPVGEDADSWAERGSVCMRRHRFESALESFGRALGHDQTSVDALLGRGNALYALKRYEDALDAYDQALVAAPDRPGIHFARSNALAMLGRPEEAAAAFERGMGLRRRARKG